MGTGGYKSAVPKWEAAEADLRKRGITPGTNGWPERAKHWWYAHGGTLDPKTGQTIFRDQILVPSKAIVRAMADAEKGLFRPDRERDELWRALGNDEKVDEHEAKAVSRGIERFPKTLTVTEAVREQRTGRQTGSGR